MNISPFFPSDNYGEEILNAEYLQDFVDNAAIALHWVDQNGVVKWANRAELDMLGYEPHEYIGHPITKFHADEEKILDILERLGRNETLNGYIAPLRCKDGSIRVVSISSNVFRKKGRFVHTRCFTVDITEQVMVTRALRESESRYASVMKNLPAAVYTCDPSGRITFFNEVAAELWGYSPDLNNSPPGHCVSFKMYLQDGTPVPAEETPMAKAVSEGRSYRNFEVIFERHDGKRIYVSLSVDPIRDEKKDITGAINIFQDITSLREARLALERSEAKYRHLIHNLPAAIYITDREGRITLYNDAAAKLWGREPEIGKDLWCGSWKILRPDGSELPLDSCPMAIALREARPVLGEEIIVVRPDGSKRRVAPFPEPITDPDGQLTGAFNMLVDVTDIRRSEEKLKETEKELTQLNGILERKIEERTAELLIKNRELKKSEERYHKMVAEVEDYAILLLDDKGIIQNWNAGAEKIKGYKAEEIVGRHFSVFYLPDDRRNQLPQQLIAEASTKGKALHEGWRLRKDGSAFWGSIVITAIHDEQHRVIGFSKVTRDLSERKQKEDQIRQYTTQLEIQNKELEQFAYAASHDMKEPLRKIQFYSQVVAENTKDILDEKNRYYLDRAVHAAKRMQKLIDDILAYTKTASVIDRFEMVNLELLITDFIQLHKEEIEQHDITVRYNQLPTVKGVPFQLKQLVDNLLGNAIKYRRPETPCVIDVSSRRVSDQHIPFPEADGRINYYQISFSDNGIGFDPRYADKIFDMFQRLQGKDDTSGSGIGLSICKKIVQNHQGFITATGVADAGATFNVYLPV